MTYPLSRLPSTSGSKQADMTRIKLADFLTQARIHTTAVEEELKRLSTLYIWLQKKESIWPDQCYYAISILKKIHQPLDAFILFLHQTSCIPLVVIASHYPLLAKLVYFDESIQSLLVRFNTLHHASRMRSEQTAAQKLELLQQMRQLLQHSEEVSKRMNALFDSNKYI